MEIIFRFANYTKKVFIPTGQIVRRKDGTETESKVPCIMQKGWVRIREDCEFRWFVSGLVNFRFFLKKITKQNQWRNRAIEQISVEKSVKVASFADIARAIIGEGCPLSEDALVKLLANPEELGKGETIPLFAPWHKPTKLEIIRLREKAEKAEESAKKAERMKKYNENQERMFLASL